MGVEALALPGWPSNVAMLTTTRDEGVSHAPFNSLNLAEHVGDVPEHVDSNRQRLQQRLPDNTRIQWLEQVHGRRVVEAGGEALPRADGCWTAQEGIACAVLTADCLPVLLARRDGSRVAAAHAGWRGLAAGILDAAVETLDVPGDEVLAWLGPAIGPRAFEVGPEVRDAFLDAMGTEVGGCFVPAGTRWLADLSGLAREALKRRGVYRVTDAGACTLGDASRYFSYRRDGQTGRMASLILRLPNSTTP